MSQEGPLKEVVSRRGLLGLSNKEASKLGPKEECYHLKIETAMLKFRHVENNLTKCGDVSISFLHRHSEQK